MKRKILLVLLIFMVTIICTVGLVACSDDMLEHEHTFSTTWSHDETYHWHAATCEHKDEMKDREEHTFEDDVCTVCGYERQPVHMHTLEYNDAREATCTEEGNVEYWHCSGCGKNFSDAGGKTEITEVTVAAKGHVWSEWTADGGEHLRVCSVCGAEERSAHTFEDGTCTVCGAAEHITEGLEFTLSKDGTYYTLTGSGTATDTEIYIPAEYEGKPVKEIGASAFEDNEKITYVVVPKGVERILSRAFYSCLALERVTLPDSVKSLGEYAFYNSGIKNIAIPAISEMGKGAFQGCAALTSVTFGEDCTLTELPYCAFYNCTALKTVELPASVTALGEYALGYTAIESIDLTYVKTFGYASLYNNAALKNLHIPAASALDTHIAYNCTALENVTFGEGCTFTELPKAIFDGCSALKRVTLPKSVTTIADDVFQSCNALESVNLPEGLTSIGDSAFWGCKSLKKIEFPASLKNIGKQAFNMCESLEGVYITDMAAWCNLNIDGSSEGNNPLRYARKLYLNNVLVENLVVPDGVTTINDSVFYGCESLISVVIPESVTSIGGNAFNGCTNLSSVIIPESVQTIKGYAFYEIPELNIYYEGTQEKWKNTDRYIYATGSAAIYFYSETQPTEEGNFWYYGTDGVTPVDWTKETTV